METCCKMVSLRLSRSMSSHCNCFLYHELKECFLPSFHIVRVRCAHGWDSFLFSFVDFFLLRGRNEFFALYAMIWCYKRKTPFIFCVHFVCYVCIVIHSSECVTMFLFSNMRTAKQSLKLGPQQFYFEAPQR